MEVQKSFTPEPDIKYIALITKENHGRGGYIIVGYTKDLNYKLKPGESKQIIHQIHDCGEENLSVSKIRVNMLNQYQNTCG